MTSIDKETMRSLFRQRITRYKLDKDLPPHMVDSLERYTIDHIQPGSFLQAVLSNDLAEAAAHADEENSHLLWNYVRFCYNILPSDSWGSAERVTNWLAEDKNV